MGRATRADLIYVGCCGRCLPYRADALSPCLLDDFSPCLVAAREPPAAAAQIPAEPRRSAPIPITSRLPTASFTRSRFDLGKYSAIEEGELNSGRRNQSTKILSRIIRIKPHI
jgi:hypothetical protein